ncbi:hypothetical protein PDESU_05653 [Pontiella desulfatans]|uniref:Uncharacterized protein n=1 Tax=Pontiella desulfatans TaxID=2750659 RepID=A0A6C2UAX4_PONDE|nr:hypothetical protein [Pontiella desulfatans]VGO17059.1 hypothetical protein PDESU_05653 [Pontiella desulfatans]
MNILRPTPATSVLKCLGMVLAGSALYGVAFGIWRSPLQACYSAIKMPLLFLSIVATSGTANAMLSQALGAGLSFRQVFRCIAIGMAIAAALLGALSPVALFFAVQLPVSSAAYPWVLLGHTALVGLCGTVGIIHLHRLLRTLTTMPNRVLTAWFLVSGFVGCQLSWIFSPFLAMPDRPEPFFNPAAFSGNFYEYLWHTLFGGA